MRQRRVRRHPRRNRRPEYWSSDIAALVLALFIWPLGLLLCVYAMLDARHRESSFLPFAGLLICAFEAAAMALLLGWF